LSLAPKGTLRKQNYITLMSKVQPGMRSGGWRQATEAWDSFQNFHARYGLDSVVSYAGFLELHKCLHSTVCSSVIIVAAGIVRHRNKKHNKRKILRLKRAIVRAGVEIDVPLGKRVSTKEQIDAL